MVKAPTNSLHYNEDGPSPVPIPKFSVFRIKICGITTVADAILAAEAGADAVGLNFYDKSPRYVTAEKAREICDALPPQVAKVGVFVNSLPKGVVAIAQRVRLTAVQLHGDEGPDFLPALGALSVIKAFRCKESTLDRVKGFLDLCPEAHRPAAILLDAHAPGNYGGTGQVLDWKGLALQRNKLLGLPLVLAGGLTAENVADAIRAAQPDAVDTASGVEASPGIKDAAKVRDFVAAARAAGL